MKKSVWAVAIAMVAVVGLLAVEPAYGKAKHVFKGMLKTFSKGTMIVECRSCKDGSYDIVLYKVKEAKIAMYKIKKSDTIVQTSLHTYNLEKIKKLTGGIGKAIGAFDNSSQGKKSAPNIFSVRLVEAKNGDLQFLLDCYHPADNSYRKTWPVDVATWELAGEALNEGGTDPREEAWSKEEKAAGSNDFPASEVGKGIQVPKGDAGAAEVSAESSDTGTEGAGESSGESSDNANAGAKKAGAGKKGGKTAGAAVGSADGGNQPAAGKGGFGGNAGAGGGRRRNRPAQNNE